MRVARSFWCSSPFLDENLAMLWAIAYSPRASHGRTGAVGADRLCICFQKVRLRSLVTTTVAQCVTTYVVIRRRRWLGSEFRMPNGRSCRWCGSWAATAAEVIAELANTGWSHRTIRTLLGRLVEKKVLAAAADGHRYVYRPLVTRQKCVRAEGRSFLNKVFAGDAAELLVELSQDCGSRRSKLTS